MTDLVNSPDVSLYSFHRPVPRVLKLCTENVTWAIPYIHSCLPHQLHTHHFARTQCTYCGAEWEKCGKRHSWRLQSQVEWNWLGNANNSQRKSINFVTMSGRTFFLERRLDSTAWHSAVISNPSMDDFKGDAMPRDGRDCGWYLSGVETILKNKHHYHCRSRTGKPTPIPCAVQGFRI